MKCSPEITIAWLWCQYEKLLFLRPSRWFRVQGKMPSILLNSHGCALNLDKKGGIWESIEHRA